MFDIQKNPGAADLNNAMATDQEEKPKKSPKAAPAYSPYSDERIVISTNGLRMKRHGIKQKAREMRDKLMQEMGQSNDYMDLINE